LIEFIYIQEIGLANVNCISSCTFLEFLVNFKKITSEGRGQHLIPVQEHVQISFSERAHDVMAESVKKRIIHVNNSLFIR
jgi:hypothetical protein